MPPVPIYVKGGVWSNLEDQILKAAIQKYGTHQWSKVASLLQRKTAKQCESRWDEFLNPKLNFQEFDRKEDAKLLDLAKKLPNQWRTIADLMGRPAHFCIERYNKLLETPGDEESDLSLGSSLGSVSYTHLLLTKRSPESSSPKETGDWKHYVCDICRDQNDKELITIGESGWQIHLKSKRHKANLNRGKRKKQYEDWKKKKEVQTSVEKGSPV